MAPQSEPVHWLVRAARTARLQDAEHLAVEPKTPAADAWTAVSRHCGVSQTDLAESIATALNLEVANLEAARSAATRLLPSSVVQQFQVFPLREDDRNLHVASADPLNLDTEQAIAFASGRKPVMAVAPPAALSKIIESRYSPDRAVETLLAHVDEDLETLVSDVDDQGPAQVTADEVEGGPVIKLTNLIFRDAVARRASDIHIQPGAGGGVVRFRIDGVLSHYMQLPLPVMDRVVSRIKVLSDIDLSNRLKPHDGRTSLAIANRVFDMRISTVPTRGSEKAVIRLLDPTSSARLDTLGLADPELERLRTLLKERQGIILVTGPTGSGKTTTLYAALWELATEDVNIMTVEDPIEYELPAATQMQVAPKQGVTFASALRAILRQDPDIILVGEIRDAETAEIAVQASLTGHLVLATVHTNDAASAVRRLVDLGLDPSALVDTVRGVVAQRLIRRVCATCGVRIVGDLSNDEQRLGQLFGVTATMRVSGCDQCDGTGFVGRLPVVETLMMSPALQTLIASGATATDLEAAAVKEGMRTLRQVGLAMEQQCLTTLGEIERVVGGPGTEPVDAGLSSTTELISRAADPTTSSAAGLPTASLDGARILVVDDDPTNRTFAKALLEREGCQVSEAADGVTALLALEQEVYSLMILDLEMPRLDGWGVLARARATVGTAGLPIIVFTSSPDPDAETQLIDRGADDYIRKPIEPRRFLARAKAALRRARG
ncbi:MAG: ATPase, T2SS/T4P/T4SS family [Dehalococcoidia bacterium]|jgi:type II secretory ATPase GspE/PulE/Tfp pilus assembly ATPase PilB-like protein|nr:ATPase, T2SS/T4P/T4SS family [Dehalococcoidia bacterium]